MKIYDEITAFNRVFADTINDWRLIEAGEEKPKASVAQPETNIAHPLSAHEGGEDTDNTSVCNPHSERAT